jgi:A/G-specific adenine glycosylase
MKRTNQTTSSDHPARPRSAIRDQLHAWYEIDGRHDLPWRLTRDRYAILVSEVMLQQTQVSRVEPRWRHWMQRWPGVGDLAAASTADVIREWSGLGYNNRAVRLWNAANQIATEHGGVVPADPDVLRGLPGIGRYTAEAVASFSDSEGVVPVDVNIGRVLARVGHGRATAREVAPGAIRRAAITVAGAASARDVALALMDLGALICTAREPACDRCPLNDACAWRKAGQPARTTTRRPVPRFEQTARFARGRIVAALGEGPTTMAGLAGALPGHHRELLRHYIEALVRDGLIEAANGTVRLAGDSATR